MDAKRVERGFELQGLALRRALTEAEREELMVLHAEAAAEMRTPPELADPDGDGPLEAQRPKLNGGDALKDFAAEDREKVAREVGTGILSAVLQFLKGLVKL